MARVNQGLAYALTIAIAVVGLAFWLAAGVHVALIVVSAFTLISLGPAPLRWRESQRDQILLIVSVLLVMVSPVVWALTPSRATPPKVVTPGEEIVFDLGGGVKLEMVLIPAGEFLMGSPASDGIAGSNDQPQHAVRISKPFYLGKYLVTQEQWEAVMGNNPSNIRASKNPVENVSWDDCQGFLGKLNDRVRHPLVTGAGKFRLPSEAQWEYGCRAGSTSKYFFGDDEAQLGEYAWYNKNSKSESHAVGEKKPNAWGLYDMHGNVWEWCQDWFDDGYYAKSPPDDPTGPATGLFRVSRGGSWHYEAKYCRSAHRHNATPEGRSGILGFRVALVPAEAVAERPSPDKTTPLKIQSIPPQTIEAGKAMSVTVAVEGAQRWKGTLRYSLTPDKPPGASIDPQSGEFSWTPPPDHAGGTENVTVSVEGPDGQKTHTTVAITVTPKQIAFDLGDGIKLEMVMIPAGEFVMGSPDSDSNAGPSEKPQHKVRIGKPFYLGKYLVTQEQWEAVMGNNPSNFKGPKNPVEQVSWDDCQAFLGKLNARVRGPLSAGEFRLPSEAEWEYACRAGSTSQYCFGDDEGQLGEYAWYDKNSESKSHPVGEKKPNAWGLYDMHGNLWEWCQDWYDDGYYAQSPTADPTGPATGSDRVLRGGGWIYPTGRCRSAIRGSLQPGDHFYFLGFRVSLVPAEAVAERPSPDSTALLKIQPIPPQTVEAGNPLSVTVAVEDAQRWKGKLRYGLTPDNPPGASIDPQSGEFSWTPSSDHPAGQQEIRVSVTDPDGQTAQTNFSITVRARPMPAIAPTLPKQRIVDLGDGVKLELLLVPAGSFIMGSPADEKERSNNEDQVSVTISNGFYLGKYSVTQAEFKAVMEASPRAGKEDVKEGDDYPATYVDWNDAAEFCRKLTDRESQAGRLPQGHVYALPTEAQREYACRAGTTTAYSFGGDSRDLGDYAWWGGVVGDGNCKAEQYPHRVGQKTPNPWGFYDMHGNVWEWCRDANAEKLPGGTDPLVERGSFRGARGGSWFLNAGKCRSADRGGFGPSDRRLDLGFRLALVPSSNE